MSGQLEKERLFTTVPVGRAVLSLAVPTVIAQLITVVYNMADTFFVGQDPDRVAAATLAMPVFMFLTAFANLFGLGGASMISRCLGAGERDRARQTASFCIWAAAALSLVYGIGVVLLRGTLLPLLGADDATRDFCAAYLFWTVGVGAVPTVLNAELAHLIRAEGCADQAGFGVTFGGVLNMVLDPIFIFGLGMEITGAAPPPVAAAEGRAGHSADAAVQRHRRGSGHCVGNAAGGRAGPAGLAGPDRPLSEKTDRRMKNASANALHRSGKTDKTPPDVGK